MYQREHWLCLLSGSAKSLPLPRLGTDSCESTNGGDLVYASTHPNRRTAFEAPVAPENPIQPWRPLERISYRVTPRGYAPAFLAQSPASRLRFGTIDQPSTSLSWLPAISVVA